MSLLDGWRRDGSYISLKWECYFDGIFITACTWVGQNDNLQRNQWWKFRENNDVTDHIMVWYKQTLSQAEKQPIILHRWVNVDKAQQQLQCTVIRSLMYYPMDMLP